MSAKEDPGRDERIRPATPLRRLEVGLTLEPSPRGPWVTHTVREKAPSARVSHGGATIAEPCPPAMSEQSHLSLCSRVAQINSFLQKFLESKKSWCTHGIGVRGPGPGRVAG